MKTIIVSFAHADGNPFSILGWWQDAAKSQGLAPEEIDDVIREATSGGYDHLLRTLQSHSIEPDSNSSTGETDEDCSPR